MRLRISPDLSLPPEAVTQTFGVLAVRGAGKTHTAAVMAEEMGKAGLPFVVVDPVGVWWGLRSSADGKGHGLAIPILGGKRGDVPLEKTGGQLVADLVVDNRLSCVLDISQFSEGDKIRFLVDFAERLYRRNEDPLHLFLEEADDYAPQRPFREQARLLRSWENIVRRGRARGLGITLITQRSAALNKNVLTQIETLIVLRTTSPQDRKAIAAWIEYQGQSKELLDSLPGLANGEAWVWSPSWLRKLERVKIRPRETFDSSATPKDVKGRRPPATLADVDLSALTTSMAETIERAKETDPRELAKRVRELEAELRKAKAPPAEKIVETVVEQVEVKVPVLANGVVGKLEAVAAAIAVSSKELASVAETMVRELAPWREGPPKANTFGRDSTELRRTGHDTARAIRHAPGPTPTAPARTSLHDGDLSLGKGEKTVLGVLRQWPEGRTYNELAFLAGYSAKASTLGVILAKLRGAGYVEPGNHPVRLTAAGLDAAGGYEPLPTGPTLLQHWLGHQRMGKGEREVLLVLVDQYPKDLSHDELCEMAGYSPTASTMGVILSKLRKLGLVEKNARRLAPEFAETIQ